MCQLTRIGTTFFPRLNSLCQLRVIKTKSLIVTTYLESGQHLICLLIRTRGNGVAGITVRVDDSVPSLPADDDGPFSPGRTVKLLRVTLLGHGGVGVTGDHRWDWKGKRNDA